MQKSGNSSLWSFTKTKASVCGNCWILSSNFSFLTIFLCFRVYCINFIFVCFFVGLGNIFCKIFAIYAFIHFIDVGGFIGITNSSMVLLITYTSSFNYDKKLFLSGRNSMLWTILNKSDLNTDNSSKWWRTLVPCETNCFLFTWI